MPGRGERIRTSGLYVPNVALYQAKLLPVCRTLPNIDKLSGYGPPRTPIIVAKNP